MVDHQQRVNRAVRDALDAAVGPSVRQALIRAALRATGCEGVPDDTASALRFVQGPLRRELERALGSELAGALAEEIGRQLGSIAPPALRRRQSEPRQGRSTPPKPPSRATPAPRSTRTPSVRRRPTPQPVPSRVRRRKGSEGARSAAERAAGELAPKASGPLSVPAGSRRSLPVVLLVSNDGKLTRELSMLLDLRAAVVPVQSVFELVGHVEMAAEAKPLVVLDCHHPSIRPTAVAALADELVDHHVVLWGATGVLEARLLEISPSVGRWVRHDEASEASELADRCGELVS